MATVKNCLDRKSNLIISVAPTDKVFRALELMRDQRVRSILVLRNGMLTGIVSQGDCAIKVLLPGLDAKLVSIESVMTPNPITVSPEDSLDSCMTTMIQRHIRHLPVTHAGQVIGVLSIGDIVKEVLRLQGNQIQFLETYIKGHGVS
jgi:CBS domain-containing protein